MYFFSACPALDLLLSVDGIMYISVMLIPNEAMASIVCTEAWNSARSMFVRSACNAVGHAAVENSGSTGNDVDVIVVFAFAHR